MPNIPSPMDFAAALTAQQESRSDLAIDRSLRVNFASVVRACENLGVNVGEALSSWIELDGVDAVQVWVDGQSSGAAIVSDWKRVRQRSEGLLAALVQEEHLCRMGASIGSYFRSEGSSLADQLLWARRRTVLALNNHGDGIPFHRPVMLLRVLELAIVYLKSLLPHDRGPQASGPLHHRTVRELGKLIVTRARFAGGNEEDLQLARELLQEAAAEGPEWAIGNLALCIEACLDIYHLTGQREALSEAVGHIKSQPVASDDWQAWHLNEAEVWLALIETAETRAARIAFLTKAEEALARLEGAQFDLHLEVKFKMLAGFVRYIRENLVDLSELHIRGVKFPFGLRTSSRAMPAIFFASSNYLAGALRDDANRGQYVYRDFLSELLSYIARQVDLPDERREMLKEAIRLRGPVGAKRELDGARTALAQAADYFALFDVTKNSQDRLYGIETLIRESHRDSQDPDPYVLLARDAELNGPASIPLRPTDIDLVAAVRAGDSRFLYEVAAQRAALSPDVRQRGIGGRGGVVTVEDYLGLTGQVFVFKKMSKLCLARDEKRAQAVAGALAEQDLSTRFGVIEHLLTLEGVSRFELKDDEVVSVRRYVSGRTLRRTLETDPLVGGLALLNTVDFLAFFHALESIDRDASAQGDLRSRELGRWLKQVYTDPAEVAVMFNGWMDLVREVPLVRRRDAHSLNWLVDSVGRILAVDLDSIGVRPLGYELAQLTDDHPIFDPADFEARNRLRYRYAAALRDLGVETDEDLLERGYFAALGARAVGLMTDPVGSDASRRHGLGVLRQLGLRDDEVGSWARSIDEAWVRKAGLVDTSSAGTISQADRMRISRAMAFHLRHDKTAPVSREGWIVAEELAEILNSNGHRVTAEQLIVVAGAHGEPRFELHEHEIRAAYGHTRPVKIEYSDRKPPRYLYHATPRDSLASILEARSGLLKMDRQFVHLNDDPYLAIMSASRRGQPVFVLRIDTSTVDGIVHAAGHTWLTPKVGVESMEVMTPRETSETPSA